MNCTTCGKEALPTAKICASCGEKIQSPEEVDFDLEQLRAYVDQGWNSHYRRVFTRLLAAERGTGTRGWTWNWAAFSFPLWFLYRKLYGWSFGYFGLVLLGLDF